MRALFLGFLCVTAILIAGDPANSQNKPPPGFFDLNFKVEDRTDRAAALRQRAEALRARYSELKAGKKSGGTLSEALKGLNLPNTVGPFHRRYRIDISLAEAPWNYDRWAGASKQYSQNRRHEDAQTAAFQAYSLAQTPRQKAEALDLMAENALSQKDPKKAANYYRLAIGHAVTRTRNRQVRSLLSRFVLRITDVAIDVNKKSPTACVVFSRSLAKPLPIKPQDYLRFENSVDAKISAHGRRICVNGLKFGESYKLTILAGVPGSEGGKLYADINKTLKIPNRAPSLILGSGTYILPHTGDTTVPLKSINLAIAKLDLFLIHDRALVPFMGSRLLHGNLNVYEKNRIRENLGTKIWNGSVEIQSKLNREVTTLIPVRDITKSLKPGVYALVATPPKLEKRNYWRPQATQWLVVSDIGLTTLAGGEGINVFSRSLATAEPMAKVKLKLIAKNNTVLGTAQSDARGQAHFPAALGRGKGGARPAALVAETSGGDYAFLKLDGPALDLSDRGAKGRYVRGTLDAYFFPERGIYRPGETVHLSGMLRDRKAMAVAKVPVTLTIQRPDGVKSFQRTLKGDDLGGFYLPYTLSPGARSGRWQLTVTAGEDKNIVGKASFQVDDFVPDRIAAEVKLKEKRVKLATALNILVQADFLYGAPASNLDGKVRISFRRDLAPHRGFESYQFGLVQDPYRPGATQTVGFRTDATGASHVAFKPEKLPDTSQALAANILVEVQDVNGRPVFARTELPVDLRAFDIGLRSRADGSFGDNEIAAFDLVTLSDDGKAAKDKTLKATWVREHYSYSWYRSGDSWRYRTSVADEQFAKETIKTSETGTAELTRRLMPGQYRLEVTDNTGSIASSLRFSVGWWSGTSSLDTPDALQVNLKQKDLAAGENIQGFIKAPFAGKALIKIVNDRLLLSKEILLAKDGSKFEIPADADWGPGAYVLVTAFRANAGAISRLPVRAMGLAWFTIDRKMRDRRIVIKVPENVEPQQTISIPISIENSGNKTSMKVLLAAVDEGILRLTSHKSPSPGSYYFGKQAFSLDARDYYGRLIRSVAVQRGKVRTGAGAHGRKDANAQVISRRSTRAVALYQKAVKFDTDGRAQIKLKLPDFNGALRLMAVAYSKSATAQGQAKLIVRQPLIAELLLPRFLAPGDQASATLSLQNLTDKKVSAKINLKNSDQHLTMARNAFTADIDAKARLDLPVKITAAKLGAAKIELAVLANGLKPVNRSWDLQVRPAWPIITEREVSLIKPGDSKKITMGLATDFFAGAHQQDLRVLAGPNLDPKRLSLDLRDYAYLCTEQTVSKGFPALVHATLATAYGLKGSKDAAAQSVEKALIRLSDRQNPGGGFGIWTGFGRTNPWLNVHVTDFLIRAREAGYYVSPAMLELTLNSLKQFTANRAKRFLAAKAYAHYVLARIGEANPSVVRYFADKNGGDVPTTLGLGHLAAALQIIGEKSMAERFFRQAIEKRRYAQDYHNDYGSDLRDRSALIALLAETRPEPALIAQLTEHVETAFDQRRYFNTQEMAWLLRAAAQLVPKQMGDLKLSVNGDAVAFKSLSLSLNPRNNDDVTLTNSSGQVLRAIRTRRGTKTSAPAPTGFGFEIRRTAFNMKGKRVPLQKIKQNNRYVILIEGSAFNDLYHDALIVDLLPAGLEIENAKLNSRRARQKYPFLPVLTRTEFVDARDDRYVAAVNIGKGRDRRGKDFALAYVVRAVTPGTYIKPGVFVEDMYKPQYRAIGSAGVLTVVK